MEVLETVLSHDRAERLSAQPIFRHATSFPVMLGFLLFGAVFVATYHFRLDPDVWWHIKVGQSILRTHHWPSVDPYSFTAAGTPWMAYEWLGDVLLAAVAQLGGLRGLYALLVLLGAAILIALYIFSTLRSGNSKAGFVASAVLLVFANPSFTLRPQMLGYLFLVVALIALERLRQGKPRLLWLLPLLFLVWVNTHGSFIIGLGAIAVYWASGLVEFRLGGIEARRWAPAERQRLELVFLLSLIALMITPYGNELAVYPFDMAFNQPLNVANIMEWQPMPFQQLGGKLFLALLMGFLLAQVAFRFTWRLEELALAMGGITMATLHVRFILLFVPFFVPLLSTILARWVEPYDRAKDKYVINAVLMLLVLAGVVRHFPARSYLEQEVAKTFPVRAVGYLHGHSVAGPMYNTYGYGGYLIWSLGDRNRVFIDGRADIYERVGVLADYFAIARLEPPAVALLRAYNVQSCLIDRDEALATLLAASPEWEKAYHDQVSVLFVRTGKKKQSGDPVIR